LWQHMMQPVTTKSAIRLLVHMEVRSRWWIR
jgi:hypothetical protein